MLFRQVFSENFVSMDNYSPSYYSRLPLNASYLYHVLYQHGKTSPDNYSERHIVNCCVTGWLSRFYPKSFINQLNDQEKIGKVLNEEYTPDFQIKILNLDIKKLEEPIIDIGCGRTGNLVKKLNDLKKEAFGIDRVIKIQEMYFIEKNWFQYSFENNKWGTIISNMSFTNHLLYTYKNDYEKLS